MTENIATFTTDGRGKRYWIHTLNVPHFPGYKMAPICQWSERETLECIERNGWTFVEPLAFIEEIRGKDFVDHLSVEPNEYLNGMGRKSFLEGFGNSPFAVGGGPR